MAEKVLIAAAWEIAQWLHDNGKLGTAEESVRWIEKQDDPDGWFLARDTAIDKGNLKAAFGAVRERLREFAKAPLLTLKGNHCFAHPATAASWIEEKSSGPDDLFQVLHLDDLEGLGDVLVLMDLVEATQKRGRTHAP